LKNNLYVFSDVLVDPVLLVLAVVLRGLDLSKSVLPLIEEFIIPSNYKCISSSAGSEFNTIYD
jgi:hypothetical protein